MLMDTVKKKLATRLEANESGLACHSPAWQNGQEFPHEQSLILKLAMEIQNLLL